MLDLITSICDFLCSPLAKSPRNVSCLYSDPLAFSRPLLHLPEAWHVSPTCRAWRCRNNTLYSFIQTLSWLGHHSSCVGCAPVVVVLSQGIRCGGKPTLFVVGFPSICLPCLGRPRFGDAPVLFPHQCFISYSHNALSWKKRASIPTFLFIIS